MTEFEPKINNDYDNNNHNRHKTKFKKKIIQISKSLNETWSVWSCKTTLIIILLIYHFFQFYHNDVFPEEKEQILHSDPILKTLELSRSADPYTNKSAVYDTNYTRIIIIIITTTITTTNTTRSPRTMCKFLSLGLGASLSVMVIKLD